MRFLFLLFFFFTTTAGAFVIPFLSSRAIFKEHIQQSVERALAITAYATYQEKENNRTLPIKNRSLQKSKQLLITSSYNESSITIRVDTSKWYKERGLGGIILSIFFAPDGSSVVQVLEAQDSRRFVSYNNKTFTVKYQNGIAKQDEAILNFHLAKARTTNPNNNVSVPDAINDTVPSFRE